MTQILVVDDDPIIQRLMSYMLQRAGHGVALAANGCEALAHIEKEPVDLVITDLAMPNMDGMALVQTLRADERFRKLPIIMVTASGQNRDGLTARQEGVSAYLTKPISSWELNETVSEWLK